MFKQTPLFSVIQNIANKPWTDLFYCNDIPESMLIVGGQKEKNGYSGPTPSTNYITEEESIFKVEDKQCVFLVRNEKVMGTCHNPGMYVLHNLDLQNSSAEWRIYYANMSPISDNHSDCSGILAKMNGYEVGVEYAMAYTYKIINPECLYVGIKQKKFSAYTKENFERALNDVIPNIITKALEYMPESCSEMQITSIIKNALKEEFGIDVLSLKLNRFKIHNDISAIVISQPRNTEGEWICPCGAVNTGNYCLECGTPKHEA